MYKKIILLLILIGFCTLSYVNAHDINETQNLSADDEYLLSEGTTHQLNSGDDIQNTIDLAESGDTIILNGTFKLEKSVKINKTVNIYGSQESAEIILDTFLKPGIFIVTSEASNVTLKNIKFTKGISGNSGGAVNWLGNYGVIENCEFNSNIADGNSGGALLLNGSFCNIVNSKFIRNHANYGGAVVINGNNCNISKCIFNENYASISGGAVAVEGNNNLIFDCEFNGNYLSDSSYGYGGGAIYSICEDLIIDNSRFTNNRAGEGYGGAVRLDKHTIVKNSYFNINSALAGNDIFSGTYSTVMDSHFIIDYNETQQESVNGSNLIMVNNTFNKTKIDSSITFISTGMVFDYSHSGSIYVTVKGGTMGKIQVLNHPEAIIKVLNNAVTVSNLAVGSYVLRVTTIPDENHYSVYSDLSIKVNKATAVIKASKITVALKKGTAWTVTIVDSKTGKGIANMWVTLKIYTGSKFKTVTVKTNSKGVASYKTSGLSKGSHKVVVSASHAGYKFNTLTSSIKVVKPKKLTFKIFKQTNKDGSTIMFQALNKKSKKPLNGIRLYLKIYNGKKVVKTITLKSKTFLKNKGIVGYTTNELTVGKHKVVIVPVDVKYSGSKKSTLKITKKQKSYAPYSSKISAK